MEQERIHTIISGGKAYPLHDSSAAVDIDNLEAENERQANSIKTNAAAVEAERNRAIEAENALDEKIENLPLATTENDGLMSKEDKRLLAEMHTRIEELEKKVQELIENSKSDVEALLDDFVLELQGNGVALEDDALVFASGDVQIDGDVLTIK